MKSFIRISSKVFILTLVVSTNSFSQKVVITDLSYVISREEESSLLEASVENGKYLIEILTPRRYLSETSFYTSIIFSDVILYYGPTGDKYLLDIFVVNDDLNTQEFITFLSNLRKVAMSDYFEKNLKEEGFIYAIEKIKHYINKCQIQLSIAEEEKFTPGIDDDKLEVTINQVCSGYNFVKIEVYSTHNSANPVFSEIRNYSTLTGNKINWDGKVTGQEFQFIRAADNPVSIKISLSEDESFSSYTSDRIEFEIDKTVDEWNNHKAFFQNYVIKGDFTGSKYQFYSTELRALMKATIPEQHLPDDRCPLDYIRENLVEVEFLGKTFITHQKFGEKLASVKANLNQQGNYANLSTNNPVNGSFALRKIANSSYMSPHSLACAIDIDPDRNPHIKDGWGQKVFNVIYHVTTVNMQNNTPSVSEMKNANTLFKTTFNEGYIADLQAQNTLTVESINVIFGKIKCMGEFDITIRHLIEQFYEVYDLYFKLIPSVTESERKLEQDYIDKIKGLRTQASLLETTINEYFGTLPSCSVFPEIRQKIEKDKQIILSKAQLINNVHNKSDALGIHSSFSSMNIAHEENNRLDFEAIMTSANIQSFNTLVSHINSQLMTLREYAVNGFFELDASLVNAFLDEPETRWGGNYNAEKDFMHFELYPLKANLE